MRKEFVTKRVRYFKLQQKIIIKYYYRLNKVSEKLITNAPAIKCGSYYKRCKRDCVSLVEGVLLSITVLFIWGYFRLMLFSFLTSRFALVWFSRFLYEFCFWHCCFIILLCYVSLIRFKTLEFSFGVFHLYFGVYFMFISFCFFVSFALFF